MLNKLWMAAIVILCVSVALGQSDRGSRGGRGRNRGGDRPASAEDSSSSRRNGGGSRTESFLRRIDANHNDQIDAEEVPSAQKEFIEDMLKRWGIETKYPIAMSKVLEAGSSADRLGGGNGNTAGESQSPSENKPSSGNSSGTASESAVPGFGSSNTSPKGGETGSAATSEPLKPSASSAESSQPSPSASSTPAKHEESASGSSSAASDPPKDSAKPSASKPGRFLTPKERMDKRLPDWFREKDRDVDGQVMMSEFSREWTLKNASDFDRYDLNRDGIITAVECLKGESRSHAGK